MNKRKDHNLWGNVYTGRSNERLRRIRRPKENYAGGKELASCDMISGDTECSLITLTEGYWGDVLVITALGPNPIHVSSADAVALQPRCKGTKRSSTWRRHLWLPPLPQEACYACALWHGCNSTGQWEKTELMIVFFVIVCTSERLHFMFFLISVARMFSWLFSHKNHG